MAVDIPFKGIQGTLTAIHPTDSRPCFEEIGQQLLVAEPFMSLGGPNLGPAGRGGRWPGGMEKTLAALAILAAFLFRRSRQTRHLRAFTTIALQSLIVAPNCRRREIAIAMLPTICFEGVNCLTRSSVKK
jgi:hypothetical protein